MIFFKHKHFKNWHIFFSKQSESIVYSQESHADKLINDNITNSLKGNYT